MGWLENAYKKAGLDMDNEVKQGNSNEKCEYCRYFNMSNGYCSMRAEQRRANQYCTSFKD